MNEEMASLTEDVATRLEAGGFGTAVCVPGGVGHQGHDGQRALSDEIEKLGRRPVIIGAASRRRGPLYEALSQWVESHCRGAGESTAMRLFDVLTMATDMESASLETVGRSEMIADAVVRLVEALVEDRPAVMVVRDPGALSGVERQAIVALMRHVLGTRLDGVDPKASSEPDIGFVWGAAPGEWPCVDVDVIDCDDRRVDQINRFLGDEDAVDGLLETSGDPERLDELLDAMPQTITRLWKRRVRELNEAQRRAAEYLAVADGALEVGFVDRLVKDSAVEPVRALCEAGITRREMSGGAVEVRLVTDEIREGILETIDDRRRRQLHRHLAETAVETARSDRAFVARHALAGGDELTGVSYGLPAARRLLRRGRWQSADDLLEQLRDVERLDDEERHQVLELSLRLAEARGAWKTALPIARRLQTLGDSAESSAAMTRRIATCLTRIGRSDEAREQFEAALAGLGDAASDQRAWLLLGLGRLAYRQGDYESARDRVVEIHEVLAGDDRNESREQLDAECRRLLGKVALYRGELDEAQRQFERNAAGGRQLGDPSMERRAEINLGVVAIQKRNYEQGAQRLRRALEHAGLPGESARMHCWLNLGIVEQRRGDFSSALDYYRRALREANRRRDEPAYEVAVHNLTTLYQDVGAYETARALMKQFRRRRAALDDVETPKKQTFASRWVPMVQAQMLLDERRPEEALDTLERAVDELGDDRRLYTAEVELRFADAYLGIDEPERAREVLDDVDIESASNPQVEVLYRYLTAVLARRDGDGPKPTTWRSIVEDFASIGLYQDGLAARVEWAQALVESGDSDGAIRVVDRGIENFRQRAEQVPQRFEDAFFAIPVHARLVELFDRLQTGSLPESLQSCRAVWKTPSGSANDDGGGDSSTSDIGVQRDDPEYRRWRGQYAEMIGEDPGMLQVFRFIDRVAPSETTVLLGGESGTGKELVARALHRQSHRSDGPFVKVNCAAFVEELLLSELFGHKKGAFTGAVSERKGHFERADGGTIFLDEIGDVSPKTQVALLRVLQEGTFEMVGGTESKSVDVRVLAATNRDLEAMVDHGEFRLDLYYRLKGFLIEVPPLRERRQDIPRLLRFFADEFSGDQSAPEFSEEAIQFLSRYRWPGNVRELENFARSVLLFADEQRVGMDELREFREFFAADGIDESLPDVDPDVDIGAVLNKQQLQPAVVGDTEEVLVEEIVADERSLSKLKKRLEHKCIQRALRQTGGNITQAARILQMKRPRLSQIVNGDDELLALKQELVG